MNFNGTITKNLNRKFQKNLFRLVFLAFIAVYNFAVVGNLKHSLARASGDDGIIAHVITSKYVQNFKDDQVASIFRFETPSSFLNLLPFLGDRYLGINPEIFWSLFLVLQNSLLPVSIFLITRRYVHNSYIAFSAMVLILNIRPQMLNLSFSGDLEWMPYAAWLALGITLLAVHFFIIERITLFVLLVTIGSLFHPTLGIWTLIFSVLAILFSIKRIKLNQTAISACIFLYFLSALNYLRIYLTSIKDYSKESPINYLESVLSNGHFNALNIFELTPDQNRLLIGSTVSIIGMLTFCFSRLTEIKEIFGEHFLSLFTSVLVTSVLGVFVQSIGIVFQSPFLIRTLGTRFTSLLSCILLLVVVITTIKSREISVSLKIITTLLIAIFPGAFVFLMLGIMHFLLNFAKMPNKFKSVNVVLIFTGLSSLSSTLYWLIRSISEFGIQAIELNLIESHLVSRNYVFERIEIWWWPALFVMGVLISSIILKSKRILIVLQHGLKFPLVAIFIGAVFLDGRYVNSNLRFSEREISFIEVQEWARTESLPTSRFFINSTTTYDGWRNYSLRPRTYLTPSAKPYDFYKSDL